jgi:hypothetical protein
MLTGFYTPQETAFDYSVHFELGLFLLPDRQASILTYRVYLYTTVHI